MSKIRSKISSIEADDDVVSRALGLRPIDDGEPVRRVADNEAPDNNGRQSKRAAKEEPLPAIITRPKSTFQDVEESPKWPIFVIIGLGLLWLIGSIFTANSMFGGGQELAPGQLAGLAFIVLFPLVLLGLLWTALRHLMKLSGQAVRLQKSADDLMRVDETVVRRATEMSGVVKHEIDTLNAGIDTALTRAATLQGILDEQTAKLDTTSISVEAQTKKITDRLATEREALNSISNTFEIQMKSLTENLDTHSENLAMSTKTAEQKIQEARVSVESTASKINQTSDLVRSNTMEAATTLTDNQNEILKLSEQLKERATELDTIYQKHGQDLNAMIAQLRNEQDNLNKTLEERLAKMRDVALSAQVSAERLTEASQAGRETVQSLSEAAKLSENAIKKRFTEMEEMVNYSNSRAESISEKAARRVQDSLAQTRKEISRIESDMMTMQEKLNHTPAPEHIAEPEPIAEIQPEEPKVPQKKKRGSLSLRPADGGEPKSTEPEGSSLVAGLRPAPPAGSEIMADINDEMPELPAKDVENDLDLKIEDGVLTPAKTTVSNELRRSVETDEQSGSWLKKLFSRGESESRAIDAITAPVAAAGTAAAAAAGGAIAKVQDVLPAAPEDTTSAPVNPEAVPTMAKPLSPVQRKKAALEIQGAPPAFLETLTQNGLSPHAVVDDGTILQAVENRIHKGTKQMSIGVAERLGQPIELFSTLMKSDDEFKKNAVNFAVKFHHSLTPIGKDTEAMRKQLQSPEGRLFLMCDAALNA